MSDEAQQHNQDQEAPIVDVEQLNQELPPEYAEQKVKEEESADDEQSGDDSEEAGGVGSQYQVPIGSYADFKNAVLGNGYDIDNYYGWQCWDAAALLWQQLGRSLLTGNGLAIGAWDLKRDVNKGDQFDLVGDINALQLGDVVCMRPNHIGFFDGFDGQYMRILSQNQNAGQSNPNGGSSMTIVRIVKTAFAGAFRFKQWAQAAPQEARKSNDEIANEVKAGKWGNGDDRKNRLAQAGYDYNAIQAIVNGGSAPAAPAKKSNDEIAKEVLRGDWGNGADRQRRLTEAGYDYNAVQAVVDGQSAPAVPAGHRSNDEIARQVIRGEWGNGADRKTRLQQAGYDYDAIQAIVNQQVPARKSNDEIATAVIRGDYGNGVARRNALQAAGYDPDAIQKIVNSRV